MDPDWRTSPLWKYEFCSALVQMVKAGVLDHPAAADAIARAESAITPIVLESPQDLVIANAWRYGISAYDSQYVSLAQTLGVKLVTADQPLVRKTPAQSILLDEAVAP